VINATVKKKMAAGMRPRDGQDEISDDCNVMRRALRIKGALAVINKDCDDGHAQIISAPIIG